MLNVSANFVAVTAIRPPGVQNVNTTLSKHLSKKMDESILVLCVAEEKRAAGVTLI